MAIMVGQENDLFALRTDLGKERIMVANLVENADDCDFIIGAFMNHVHLHGVPTAAAAEHHMQASWMGRKLLFLPSNCFFQGSRR